MTDTSAITGVLALWVPDWPVLTIMRREGISATRPVAVTDHGKVMAVSAAARRDGVRRGMRRRAAQAVCPSLVLHPRDEQQEHLDFDTVASAAHRVLPHCSVSRPGVLWAPWKIPVKAQADADFARQLLNSLAEPLIEHIAHDADVECHVGGGQSLLTALLAAREDSAVCFSETRDYLGKQPIESLRLLVTDATRETELTAFLSALTGLGVRTLRQLAEVGRTALNTRFGHIGQWAYLQALGCDTLLNDPWRQVQEIKEELVIDPPAERSDHVTFATAEIAQNWYQKLLQHSLSCSQVEITLTTQDGDEIRRCWQADSTMWGGLTPRHVTDRIRWQMDGWLTRQGQGIGDDPPVAPVAGVTITAVGLHAVDMQSEGLWGLGRSKSGKVAQTVARLQAMLGPGEVLQPVAMGGRTARERVQLVPWGSAQPDDTRRDQPWPGALPSPSPTVIPATPLRAHVLDSAGNTVIVDRRLRLSAPPVRVTVDTMATYTVQDWAGPWPLLQRWWRAQRQTAAYLQVTVTQGAGLLLACQEGQWSYEGKYD